MTKKDIHPMPKYFDRYIALADDVEHMKALEISLQELEKAPVDKWKAIGDKVYAEGKWTIKDLLQHMIDTERVFAFRATSFARNDQQVMLGFDEELFAKNTNVNNRTIDDLMEELILVRKSYIMMFTYFTDEMLLRIGNSYNSQYAVLSMAFIIAGHQRWHFKVLEERYFPLLEV